MPFEWNVTKPFTAKSAAPVSNPKFTDKELRLLQLMSKIEKEEGAVDRDVLPGKLPDIPTEEIFQLITQLQLKGELLEPFPHFYRVMHPTTVSTDVDTSKLIAFIWEVRMPKSPSSKKKGPYEFTKENKQSIAYGKIAQAIASSGKYHITLDGYTYWLMTGGLARRKVREEDKNADK
jgi:hypothetical protein